MKTYEFQFHTSKTKFQLLFSKVRKQYHIKKNFSCKEKKVFFNKLQYCLYSKLRYVDDTFLFGNSCCLERAARYITYIVVDRTRGVNMLFVVFVWVGAHQHRQADRGIIKNLLKYGGYAFFVSSVSC